ncbi:LOW QUALITY PROTEIN: hypothetical protein HID58_047954 [Brassica napus]|uniref:Uncharacterized protein n=1 Tax=Brassica napus TaxID=3708 RepID=A0ABQ8B2A9_BRANA|nr:LOW QUALITY PROTEIN: hypothetical protein HID58_047954 [Brassica napus]
MEGCIPKPSDFGRACLGSSGFHESTRQGHPSIDCGLPSRADCNWQRINGRVQLMFTPSLFGMETTARRQQHVQEIYSGTKNQLGTKMNMLNVPSAKSKVQSRDEARSYNYNIKTSRIIKYANYRHEDLNESPLQLLQAQEAQERPVESSMRILSFGLRVLLNLLIVLMPLILSLAKILPLRIPGSSISILGMRRSITLYADVSGFSI